MKRFFHFSILAAAMMLAACQQQGPETDTTTRVQIITPESSLTFDADGGKGELSFELTNPVENGEIKVVLEDGVDWIKIIELKDFGFSGNVTFEVSPFEGIERRNADITVKYTYGGQTTQDTKTIIQNAFEYDYVLNAKAGKIVYYGDVYSDGSYNYMLYLGSPTLEEGTPDAIIYQIDLFSTIKTEDRLPEPGVYTLDEREKVLENDKIIANDTFNTIRYICDSEGEMLISHYLDKEGVLYVERDGDKYVITGKFTDDKLYTHFISYKGELILEDRSHYSDLEGDTELDLTGMQADVWYWGHPFGTALWTFILRTDEKAQIGSTVITLQLTAGESGKAEDGFFGSFTPDYSGQTKYTFLPGNIANETCAGGWYVKIADIIDGGIVPGSPRAPFRKGRITTAKHDDTSFDLEIDVVDDNENRITAKGVIPYVVKNISSSPALSGQKSVSPYLPEYVKTINK